MIDLDDGLDLKNKIQNQLKVIHENTTKQLFREKDKMDRQTRENCIDARVSHIIKKFKHNSQITEFSGCISTGKEANVYYAKGIPIKGTDEEKELAVKIYKTSILIFKDRERYITGEFRFRHGYCKGNPRKMVSLWAEKEVRNLKRIRLSGINAPIPYLLKSNVIVMEFIGEEGVNAPRLKDAMDQFESIEEIENLYKEIVKIMFTMFRKCKLVHSDFSEYNLLYHDKKVYVIDVAQAVEHDHPNSLPFLKRDCHNINEFFSKNGIEPLLDEQLFNFISRHDSNIDDLDNYLTKSREENKIKINENKKYIEDSNCSFMKFIIPRTLMEEDVDKIVANEDIEIALTNLVGIVKQKEIDKNYYSDGDRESSDSESEEEEGEHQDGNQDKDKDNEKEKEKKKKFDPFEGMTKQERKNKVKLENREKRQNKKMHKKEKQQIIKKTTVKKK